MDWSSWIDRARFSFSTSLNPEEIHKTLASEFRHYVAETEWAGEPGETGSSRFEARDDGFRIRHSEVGYQYSVISKVFGRLEHNSNDTIVHVLIKTRAYNHVVFLLIAFAAFLLLDFGLARLTTWTQRAPDSSPSLILFLAVCAFVAQALSCRFRLIWMRNRLKYPLSSNRQP